MPFSYLSGVSSPLVLDAASLEAFILEHEPNLVFVKDEDGRLVYANMAFLAIYAPSERSSVIGSTTVESFTPAEVALFRSEDRRALREGHSEMVEEVVDWTGRSMTLLTRKIAVQLTTGEKRLVCISTNITELASRERRLVRLNAQLKIFSHTIAHDLKNPLASIIAGLNLMERDKGSALSERSAQVLAAARESAFGLAGYVTSMLRAAALEAGSLALEQYDLNLLFEEVRFNLSAALEAADCNLHVARLPVATVDPNLLRHLFQNLIENSIKHAGSKKLVITVHYRSEPDDHVFYVGDNGKGIAPEKKEAVFGQYFRDGSAEGLGLGLATCQRIAHLHDGFISVQDRVEEGCCMVVRIAKSLTPTLHST